MDESGEFRRIIEGAVREYLQTATLQFDGGQTALDEKALDKVLTRAAVPILAHAARYDQDSGAAVLDLVVRCFLRMTLVVVLEEHRGPRHRERPT